MYRKIWKRFYFSQVVSFSMDKCAWIRLEFIDRIATIVEGEQAMKRRFDFLILARRSEVLLGAYIFFKFRGGLDHYFRSQAAIVCSKGHRYRINIMSDSADQTGI